MFKMMFRKHGPDGQTECLCETNCQPGFTKYLNQWYACKTAARRGVEETFLKLNEIRKKYGTRDT